MSLLTRVQHSYIDIITVLVFAFAPLVLGLEGAAAALSYSLAGVHGAMTLVTAGLPFSTANVIPLPLHGLIEAAVGVGLGVTGWLGFDGVEQAFYLAMAALILLVFALTPYLDTPN